MTRGRGLVAGGGGGGEGGGRVRVPSLNLSELACQRPLTDLSRRDSLQSL